jgi:hypothetical protein
METTTSNLVVAKLNVKSGLILIALILCTVGLYLCISGITQAGSIDIKSTLLEGKITTESLGLLVIFLALPVASAAKALSLREKHIEIMHGDLRVNAANMSENEWSHIVDFVKEHESQHRAVQSKAKLSGPESDVQAGGE